MVVQAEQNKIQTLLQDAVTTLCKANVTFQARLCIDALVTLTVDQHEPFPVHINSIVNAEIEETENSQEESRSDFESCETEDLATPTLSRVKQEITDTYEQTDDWHEEMDTTTTAEDTSIVDKSIIDDSVSKAWTVPAKRSRKSRREGVAHRKSRHGSAPIRMTIIKTEDKSHDHWKTTQKVAPPSKVEPPQSADAPEYGEPINEDDGRSEDKDLYYKFAETSAATKPFKAWIEHVKREDGVYKCELCSYQHSQKNLVVRHAATHRGQKVQCQYCDEMFENKFQRKIHATKVHTDDKPQCKICLKHFSTLAGLNIHDRNIHRGLRDKERKCPKCDYTSRHFGNMSRHIKCHGANENVCHFCGMEHPDKISLKEHINLAHPDDKLACEFCDKFFKTTIGLEHHIKVDHGDGTGCQEAMKCSACNFATLTIDGLNKHMCVGEEDKLICDICKKQLTCKAELKTHRKDEHKSELKKRQCPYCPKVYYSKNGMYAHKKLEHSGITDPEKKNVCTCHICGKGFPIHEYLKRHISNHDDTLLRYHCPKCGRRFKYHRNCKTHKEGCMNEGGYTCHICGKSLKNDYSLREHVRNMHTKDRKDTYPCRKCGMLFSYSGSRCKHEKLCLFIAGMESNPNQNQHPMNEDEGIGVSSGGTESQTFVTEGNNTISIRTQHHDGGTITKLELIPNYEPEDVSRLQVADDMNNTIVGQHDQRESEISREALVPSLMPQGKHMVGSNIQVESQQQPYHLPGYPGGSQPQPGGSLQHVFSQGFQMARNVVTENLPMEVERFTALGVQYHRDITG